MPSNYPPGAEFDPNAPYNQVEVPEKDFEVTCCQALSRTAIVTTNNYIPGASGADYEYDGEGGYVAIGWHDPDDTSDTNWLDEYKEEHYTPMELIEEFKKLLEELKDNNGTTTKNSNFFNRMIEECEGWVVDETVVEL